MWSALDPQFAAVLDKEVDGTGSLPGRMELNPTRRISQVRAATRAARAVFLCSAPLVGRPNAGLTGRGLRLSERRDVRVEDFQAAAALLNIDCAVAQRFTLFLGNVAETVPLKAPDYLEVVVVNAGTGSMCRNEGRFLRSTRDA